MIVMYCLTQIQFKDYGDIQRGLERVDVPEAIDEILKRCVSTTPSLRLETATGLLAEIGRVQDQRAASSIRRRRVHLCLSRERAERVGAAVGASTKRRRFRGFEDVAASCLRQSWSLT